jgi:hypothetical protein
MVLGPICDEWVLQIHQWIVRSRCRHCVPVGVVGKDRKGSADLVSRFYLRKLGTGTHMGVLYPANQYGVPRAP